MEKKTVDILGAIIGFVIVNSVPLWSRLTKWVISSGIQ